MSEHKSGFVNIIGNPNVGKSTLMNQLLGEKISIITSKAQTTRHRIFGIWNDENHQIVFSDTPGILEPKYKLQEAMMSFVKVALNDADVFIVMVSMDDENFNREDLIEKIKLSEIPVIVIINKIDLSNQELVNASMDKWRAVFPKGDIFPISAKEGYNIDKVLLRVKELLPEGPEYYEKDQLTDRPEKFFVTEIIREKILLYYKQEIPYSVEVEVESFKESEEIIRIRAIIYVERDSQKGIIIGKKGEAIKKVGIEARKSAEEFFNKHIHLELFVKVKKDWKSNPASLRKFGYND
jgi:GTPase